jgi:rod shape determining protein RodA
MKIDWWLVATYIALTLIGWVNIFSSVYDQQHSDIFDLSQRYGMQFVWIGISWAAAFTILFLVNPKIYPAISWLAYWSSILLLISVLFLGIEVSGSRSWLALGPLRFQPAEVAKIATTMAVSSLLSSYGFRLKSWGGMFRAAFIILLPALIIIMQKETGSALVYSAFLLVFYREGMSGWILTLGIFGIILFLVTLSFSPIIAAVVLVAALIATRGFLSRYPVKHLFFMALYLPVLIFSLDMHEIPQVAELIELPPYAWTAIAVAPLLIYHVARSFRRKSAAMWSITIAFFTSLLLIYSVEFLFDNVLQSHQRERIENLLGIDVDLQGAGYNVHQSKIAIGSGGLYGKGFLQGTQTKFDFVPEQSTDFIFCTIGEEWGFVGSTTLIILFLFLMIRILNSAEKQKDAFSRIYGYSLASVIFIHFMINIGMTIGITPVIGIPLPFVSYGGSSLLGFTIFLFIFIRLDLDRRR